MNNNLFKLLFLSLILFPSCYSFYSTDTNELRNLSEVENIEVRLERKESIKFYNVNKINFFNNDTIQIINNDSLKSSFALKEVNGFAIEKFDYTKTILTSVFIITLIILINGGLGSPGG